MDKKKFIFSSGKVDSRKVDFKEKKGKAVMEMTFFSTANNRNKVWFQVSDLMKTKGKEGKLLLSFNHNLSETGGKYLGNQTKVLSIDSRFVNGDLEIYGKIESTDDKYVLPRLSDITAPSIEVSSQNWIEDENGVYLIDIEWVGITFLTGIPQGSGDARLDKVSEFSEKPNMDKETIVSEKSIQTELKKEFQEEIEPKTETKEDAKDETVEAKPEAKADYSKDISEMKDSITELTKVITNFMEENKKEEVVEKSKESQEPKDEVEAKFEKAESQLKAKTKLSKFEKVEEESNPTSESTNDEMEVKQKVRSFLKKIK